MPAVPWHAAVRSDSDGVVVALSVVPDAASTAFPDGYDAWRERIRCRVTAPAVDGRANDAVRAVIATFFDVSASQVRIGRGAKSRQKDVSVTGRSIGDTLERLDAALAEPDGDPPGATGAGG